MMRRCLLEVRHNIAILETGLTHFENNHQDNASAEAARAYLWKLAKLMRFVCLEELLGYGELGVQVQKDLIKAKDEDASYLISDGGEGVLAKIHLKILEIQTLSELSATEDPEHTKPLVRLKKILDWHRDARNSLELILKCGKHRATKPNPLTNANAVDNSETLIL
jgi:hypothetical protein